MNQSAPAAAASVSLAADDDRQVDPIHERSGCTRDIVSSVTDTPFGSHQFAVRDPEGHT